MDRKRLLLVHTGGTLGMLAEGEPGPLAPSTYAENLLPYVRGLEDRFEIAGERFCNLDSTDLTPSHWEDLAHLLAEHMNDYDGFVVLHGTDTMAYTASALSLVLANLPRPVVLTGAQRPVTKARTDARTNLVNSAICAGLDIPEVGLYFGSHLFRGNRSTKVSVHSYEAFESPNFLPLAEIGVDVRVLQTPMRPKGDFQLRTGFERRVIVLYLFPGSRAGALRAAVDAGAKGVVLLAFGSGNVPLDGWPEAISDATEAGVPVVIRSQCLEGATDLSRYRGGARAMEAGAVCAGDMTTETAIVRTMFLLHSNPSIHDFRSAWQKNIAGEMS
ncbi:MAG: asparaginase [Myxococcota bacterium]|nr:asparaginase [Myxococcota bacterium]